MIFYFTSDENLQNHAITRHLKETARLKTETVFILFSPLRSEKGASPQRQAASPC